MKCPACGLQMKLESVHRDRFMELEKGVMFDCLASWVAHCSRCYRGWRKWRPGTDLALAVSNPEGSIS